ncbi:MAG: alpha-D-ribose 1-methylphosphonate 5-triphosphate diphosphatase, partial [Hyphomicrobiales bacterium]
MTFPARSDVPLEPVASMAIRSSRVVLNDRVVAATVIVENGLIVAVDETSTASGVMDIGDDLLIPGLVELHTDHLEPHYSPRPKVLWNPFSAVFAYDAQIASAGITTVFDSLRAGSDGDAVSAGSSLRLLGEAIERAKTTGLLRADHHTHLRCEVAAPDVVSSAAAYVDRFDVRLMSLMDHTPGQRQFRDEEKLKDYYRGKTGKSDDELNKIFDRRRELSSQYAGPHRRALVDMAHDRSIALASHDDTTIAHVEEAVLDRMQVAEFPTTLEAAQASHKAGLAVLMGAPNVVRGGSHSGNVSAR